MSVRIIESNACLQDTFCSICADDPIFKSTRQTREQGQGFLSSTVAVLNFSEYCIMNCSTVYQSRNPPAVSSDPGTLRLFVKVIPQHTSGHFWDAAPCGVYVTSLSLHWSCENGAFYLPLLQECWVWRIWNIGKDGTRFHGIHLCCNLIGGPALKLWKTNDVIVSCNCFGPVWSWRSGQGHSSSIL